MFWNAGKKKVNADITELILDTNTNFLALAEYSDDSTELLNLLFKRGLEFYSIPLIGCDRIKIFSDIKPSKFKLNREADRYTILELNVNHLPILVGLVHLPSKLYKSDDDQCHNATFFKQDIELAEAAAGHTNTIIFGDFNMNPFDKGMIAAGAINSVPCLKTSEKVDRVIEGRKHSFFYNPSWSLLGDADDNPGTYYHNSPSTLSHYWNTLDQVVIRPSIGNMFNKKSLKTIKKTSKKSLVSSVGKPDISDHLPIFFSMDLTSEKS